MCFATLAVAMAGAACAEEEYRLDIPAQSVAGAVKSLSFQTNHSVLYQTDQLGEAQTIAINGNYSIEEALNALLRGTGLQGDLTESGMIVVSQNNSANALNREETAVNNQVKRSLLASAAALVFGTGAPGIASAQDESGEDQVSVQDTITVTATRREENLQDVPMAVSVVRTDEFARTGVTRIDEIIEYVPGFDFLPSELGARGTGTILARGVGQLGDAAVVGVYLDDVLITGSTPWSGAAEFAFDGSANELERVEFLKGPQGTLYGGTSIGGAVRYVTRAPELESVGGRLFSDFSNAKDGEWSHRHGGRVSVPLVQNKLGVAISGVYEDFGGFVDLVDGVTGELIAADVNSSEAYSVAGDVLFVPSDTVSLRLRAMYQNSRLASTNSVDMTLSGDPVLGARTSTQATPFDGEQEVAIYSGVVNVDLGFADLISSTAYTQAEAGNENQFTGLNIFFDNFLMLPAGTTTSLDTVTSQSSDRFSQEIRLVSASTAAFAGDWEWLLGVFYTNEDAATVSTNVVQPAAVDFISFSTVADYQEVAGFASATYFVSPQFDISAGVRVSSIEMELTDRASGIFSSGAPSSEPIDEMVDTYHVALRYRPTSDFSVYARAASGYRPPSSNQSVVNPVTSENIAPQLIEADSLWSYEIGAKGQALGGRLGFDISAWRLDWENFQATFGDPATNLQFRGNAAGGVKAIGVEMGADVELLENLTLVSSVVFSQSELRSDEPGLNGLKGQQLPFVPKWTASSRLSYEYPISNEIDGSLGLGVRYVGSVRSAFEDGAPTSVLINVPTNDRAILDLSAGIQKGGVAINGYVTNLLDNDVLTRSVAGRTLAVQRGVPIRPREIGVRVSAAF